MKVVEWIIGAYAVFVTLFSTALVVAAFIEPSNVATLTTTIANCVTLFFLLIILKQAVETRCMKDELEHWDG